LIERFRNSAGKNTVIFEPYVPVTAVAEGFVGRVSATAQYQVIGFFQSLTVSGIDFNVAGTE